MTKQEGGYEPVGPLSEQTIIDIPFVLGALGLPADIAFVENFLHQRKKGKAEPESYINPEIWKLLYSQPSDAEEGEEASPRFMDYLFDHLKDDKEFHEGYIGLEERFGDYRQLSERHIGKEQQRAVEEHIRGLGKSVRDRDLMMDSSPKSRFDNNKYN